MRLLLVEDDRLLGDGVKEGLKQAGYAVDWVQDGVAAELALGADSYDLAVLDIMLPRQSGFDVLKGLRTRGNQIPVLMLTARDDVDDRIKGLDLGADDYLTKPFDLDELLARLRSILRRSQGRATPLIEHAGIRMDPAAHQVSTGGVEIELTPREFAILQLLLERQGKVLTRQRLEESLYAWDKDVESNSVEVHIHHLRKKLGAELIRTIRGVGYVVD